ncbi:MAG: uL30 family ribosomal protein [Nitrososphaerota archaeon]|jgi:large subunit ribosomal protein L30|nr:uL30 family ribosomal protein [Nitrososphaerota archaeon]MDG7041905.1 uL30 family ribosomal protein [Nitrososphaerota archaeon]MDG7043338.1 uL30 family ribosomal protein [Nitrososphaerota archaeon]MDG7046558.1 uL30 family ribosomal protein [Nitrososphaerota archaeon]
MTNILIIRIKGTLNVRYDMADTLRSLNLRRKFNATIVRDSPVLRGMLQLAKDFIIWSEVDDKLALRLFKERGRTTGWRRLDEKYLKEKGLKGFSDLVKKFSAGELNPSAYGIKPYFSLPPPKRGFPRRSYSATELLKRMLPEGE